MIKPDVFNQKFKMRLKYMKLLNTESDMGLFMRKYLEEI